MNYDIYNYIMTLNVVLSFELKVDYPILSQIYTWNSFEKPETTPCSLDVGLECHRGSEHCSCWRYGQALQVHLKLQPR